MVSQGRTCGYRNPKLTIATPGRTEHLCLCLCLGLGLCVCVFVCVCVCVCVCVWFKLVLARLGHGGFHVCCPSSISLPLRCLPTCPSADCIPGRRNALDLARVLAWSAQPLLYTGAGLHVIGSCSEANYLLRNSAMDDSIGGS